MWPKKQLFTQVRESQKEDYGEELYNQWMHHLEAQKNHKSNQAIDILNEVFDSFGDIYGFKKNEDEKRNI